MLIDLKKLERGSDAEKGITKKNGINRYINESVNNQLSEQLGNIVMGETIYYSTGAKWSLHDLLVKCLAQTGPADVHLCFYAIKEYQARLLSKMKNEGHIQSLNALLFYRAGVNDPGAVQVLSECSDTFGLMRTHAKLLVIRNDNWGVSIIGSANLTTNTQADVGIITCDTTIADYWIEWIKKNIHNGN